MALTTGPEYPERQALRPEQVSWQTEMADYDPEDFTAPDPSWVDKKIPDPVQLRRGGGNGPGGEELGGTVNEYLAYLGRVGSEGLGIEALNRARKAAGITPLDPLEKRQTYEGSIAFDKDGRPLNPRGRTGLRGRGSLLCWGPNHAVDTIVTRYHPRHDSLQFVAIPKGSVYALPGNVAAAGTTVAPRALQILKAEAAVVQSMATDPSSGAEDAAHLEELVQELFAGTEKKSVYTGNTYDVYVCACACACVFAFVCARAHACACVHVLFALLTRLRRRPAQHGQCVARDVCLSLPLQP